MPTLRQQLDEANRHIASLHARYVQAEQWRQEALAENNVLMEELTLVRDSNALAARLKEMADKVSQYDDLANTIAGAEAFIQTTGYSEIHCIEMLCYEFNQQKAKIAELENALCIEGNRLTEAWKTIANLKGKQHATQT